MRLCMLTIGGVPFMTLDRDERLDSNVVTLYGFRDEHGCKQLMTFYSRGKVEWVESPEESA